MTQPAVRPGAGRPEAGRPEAGLSAAKQPAAELPAAERPGSRRSAAGWVSLAVLVPAQIAYPLTGGRARADLVIATVVLGFAISLTHAMRTRGRRVAIAVLGAMTAVGGVVEAVGVHTGHPFGGYGYAAALGPRVFGVPVVVPLAWAWLGWPAWLAAVHLTPMAAQVWRRVAIAAVALAAWDLFLDPQMVAAGYWRWSHPRPALPGVAGVPLSNYAGWLAVALVMMVLFAATAGPRATRPTVRETSRATRDAGPVTRGGHPTTRDGHPTTRGGGSAPSGGDAPMLAMYLWIYTSSVLANAVFLDLPGSAAWGGIGMGLVAVPLARSFARRFARPLTRDRTRARTGVAT